MFCNMAVLNGNNHKIKFVIKNEGIDYFLIKD